MEDGWCEACFGRARYQMRTGERAINRSTVALLRLSDGSVLVASVYVAGSHGAAPYATIDLLIKAIHSARRRGAPRMDIAVKLQALQESLTFR